MEITLEVRRYKLVPIEDNKEEHSVLDDYIMGTDKHGISVFKANEPLPEIKNSIVRDAIPQVSDYRERYKKRQVKVSEVTAQPRVIEFERKDNFLDDYNYEGEGLFFGEGLSSDY